RNPATGSRGPAPLTMTCESPMPITAGVPSCSSPVASNVCFKKRTRPATSRTTSRGVTLCQPVGGDLATSSLPRVCLDILSRPPGSAGIIAPSGTLPLTPGERLGSYEIVSLLGTGGMGVVYRAHDTHLPRTIPLKGLSEERPVPGTPGLLLHETRAPPAPHPPHISPLHQTREEAGRVFIVMEFIDGRPLSQSIPVGGLPADSLLRCGTQIADALAHAHDHGVLHRDLKSANVIVTREGRTKIVDFGLSRRFAHI